MLKTRYMSAEIRFQVPADLSKDVQQEIYQTIQTYYPDMMSAVMDVIERAGYHPVTETPIAERIQREN